ncbi:hypothetical protein QJS66_23205 [Kocuria rhizophila]|nr:hypothetical protein QJS66_23205 [Kocuria rhizophila]
MTAPTATELRAAAVLGLPAALALTGCSADGAGGRIRIGGLREDPGDHLHQTLDRTSRPGGRRQGGGHAGDPLLAQDHHRPGPRRRNRPAVEKRPPGAQRRRVRPVHDRSWRRRARAVDAVEVSGLQSEQDREAAEEHDHDHGSGSTTTTTGI